MRLFSKFLIFIFLLFLSTPTIITLIEKTVDISKFYSFAEEEHSKEIKAEVKYYFDNNSYSFVESINRNSFFLYESEHQLCFREIFSPPPNFI
jgi:hypothetical protein